MRHFESPPINSPVNRVFEWRSEYIHEVGEQLSKKTAVHINVCGKRMNIDFRTISVRSLEGASTDAVVLLPGFGSGWEGIAELGFSLACEGRKVIMPSLPGYGNSDDPSPEYYVADNFENEAEALWECVDALSLKQNRKFHFVGHSMGSEIISALAVKHPEIVSSLTLLNPAGAREAESACSLMKRFIGSGLYTAVEFSAKFAFSGERDYEEALRRSIPGSKSPFALSRISQRLSETKRLLEGRLLENIRNTNCPIIYISGSLDTVYPPGKTADDLSLSDRIMRAAGDPSRFYSSVMVGLRHNTTLAPDEITAANIAHYLEEVEGSRSA